MNLYLIHIWATLRGISKTLFALSSNLIYNLVYIVQSTVVKFNDEFKYYAFKVKSTVIVDGDMYVNEQLSQ